MSTVGNQPTETYADFNAIISSIRRMTVPPVKQTIKNISDSHLVQGYYSTAGLKRDLVDRLIGIFTALKDSKMSDQYRESRRILEEQYGSRITVSSGSAPSWRYMPPQPQSGSSGIAYPYGMASLPAKPSPFSSTPHHYLSPGMPTSSSMPSGPVSYQPQRRPNFLESPFLQVKEWVGGAVICPEAPNHQQRSSATFKMNLNATNREMLKLATAVHQLRLYCTSKSSYDAALHPSHAAPVEFPINCEVKVNNVPLSINLKGKKTAAKVLPPNLHKDKALYFGGQENKVELIYHNTIQKYVLSVAICEVRSADTLARRIRREKFRSKEDVLGAMKRAAEDDDIEMGDVLMGLKCPLSSMRLNTPIRSTVCTHMQCFDALSFFSINEQTPSWQCPHCSKSIKPDSLFLDGYVQDILNKVPEEEETVLVDDRGRWHTPNKKYFSGTIEAASEPSLKLGEEAASADSSTVAKASDSAAQADVAASGTVTPSTSVRSKVEVFEIDDDDEEEEQQQRIATEAGPSTLGARPFASSTQSREASLVGIPPTSAMGNGRTDASSTSQFLSDASTSTRLSSAPTMPQSRQDSDMPRSDVIDLTFSDSDEEAAPRGGEEYSGGGYSRWDANGAFPAASNGRTSSSDPRNGPPVPPPLANGHDRPGYHEQARPRPGHAFRTGAASFTSAPRPERRSNSHLEADGGEEEEQDGDDSLPVLPRRKKRRPNAGLYANDDEEEEESPAGARGNSEEELYDDERAGLTMPR